MKKVLFILAFNEEEYRYGHLYLITTSYWRSCNNTAFSFGDLLIKVSTYGVGSSWFHEMTIEYKDELVLYCEDSEDRWCKGRFPPLRTFECFHKGEWINVINILHKSAKKSIKDWRLIQKKREKERKEKAFSPIDNE